MNPVLLKPESESGAQVVVQGQRLTTTRARDYARLKPTLMGAVRDSFDRLSARHDLILIEGAGSPAEINLRAGDIANMGFAEAAGVPVVLCADINRGGVIAQVVGTQAVLPPQDAARIRGFLINKFRGDPRLFDDGYQMIADRTGWPGFGVLPWFADAWKLPAEDAYDIRTGAPGGGQGRRLHVVCLQLSRIANFDDLDPLSQEPGLRVTMLRAGQALPGDADLVILPGSKSTRGDLAYLRAQGWDTDLAAHIRRGGHVLGICGGYQMLGRSIADPDGIEGPPGTDPGLGLLNVDTVMVPDKAVRPVTARHAASGMGFSGYEIHVGRTDGPDTARPFAHIGDQPDGAISADGRITGTYLHGMFAKDGFRQAWLAGFGVRSDLAFAEAMDSTLDALADHLETHADLDGLLAAAAPPAPVDQS